MRTFSAQEANKLASFLGSVNLADALDVVLYKICLAAKEGYYSIEFNESTIQPNVKEYLIEAGYKLSQSDTGYYKVSW